MLLSNNEINLLEILSPYRPRIYPSKVILKVLENYEWNIVEVMMCVVLKNRV